MAKKKELYTLSKDGEVISGVEIKTKVKNKVLLDLGQGEGLLVKNKIDVFQTEQEAINEQNDIWFDSIIDTFDFIEEDVEDLDKKLDAIDKERVIDWFHMDKRISKLESKKWYEFWK